MWAKAEELEAGIDVQVIGRGLGLEKEPYTQKHEGLKQGW